MSDNKIEKADKVFADPLSEIKPFEFNSNVADVFDDMAVRSIPFYVEVQKMIASLAMTYYRPGTKLYDLGCSTGTTLSLVAEGLKNEETELIGIDASGPMCNRAGEKLSELGDAGKRVEIVKGDILKADLLPSSVIIMNYTLQFVDPLHREVLIQNAYESLCHNGILLVSDKTLQSHTDISRYFVDFYYDLKKKNGYSELEISQKREALDNVLIPYRFQEERELFSSAGFAAVDTFFTWYNFSSFICLKK